MQTPKYAIDYRRRSVVDGRMVYPITALRDVGSHIKKGDQGGCISGEHNLSHDDASWVHQGAYALDDCLVMENAQVFGFAKISGEAVIRGHARVYGDAIVTGNAIVSGWAKVYDEAFVTGTSQVMHEATVCGVSEVKGEAVVMDHAEILGCSRIEGRAIVMDYALVAENAAVRGDARICNNACVTDNAIVCGFARLEGQSAAINEAIVMDRAILKGNAIAHKQMVIGGEVWCNGIDHSIHPETAWLTGRSGYSRGFEIGWPDIFAALRTFIIHDPEVGSRLLKRIWNRRSWNRSNKWLKSEELKKPVNHSTQEEV